MEIGKKIGLRVLAFFVIMATLSLPAFGQSLADKPGEWHVGEGLKQGDLFSYNLCHIDYNECAEFQMDWWIEDEITTGAEQKWLAQVVVYDGDKIVKGTMELDMIAPEPTNVSADLEVYADVYKTSLVWFSSYANADEPKKFNATSWGKIGNIGGQQIRPISTETITVPADTFETVLVTWRAGGLDSKVWVADEFSYPVKAETWTHVSEGDPPPAYNFELLDYQENINSDPFAGITPTEPEADAEQEPEAEPEQEIDEVIVETRTSKSEYDDGNLIIILGEVSFILKDEPVTIEIFHRGDMIFEKEVEVSSTRSFTLTIQTPHPAFQSSGIYTAKVTYGNSGSAETSFEFTSESAPEVEAANEVIPPDDTMPLDVTPPEVLVPSDITISTNNEAGTVVEFSVKAIDDVDQIITSTCEPQSGSTFPVGNTLVTCTAADSSGNTDAGSFTVLVEYSEFVVPDWIKDVAGFWCNDEIDDSSFVDGIQYLITNQVIVVQATESTEVSSEEIPDWIKNNACWWSKGLISDGDFVGGIEYLIEHGIIQV